MQKTIKIKLDIMRRVLEKDPFNLVIGDIVEERSLKTIVNDDLLQDYYLLLNEYSSIRCGVVIIFGRNEREANMYLLYSNLKRMRKISNIRNWSAKGVSITHLDKGFFETKMVKM